MSTTRDYLLVLIVEDNPEQVARGVAPVTIVGNSRRFGLAGYW